LVNSGHLSLVSILLYSRLYLTGGCTSAAQWLDIIAGPYARLVKVRTVGAPTAEICGSVPWAGLAFARSDVVIAERAFGNFAAWYPSFHS